MRSLAIVEAASTLLSVAGATNVVPTPLELITLALGLKGPFDFESGASSEANGSLLSKVRGKLHGLTCEDLLVVNSRLTVPLRRSALAHEQAHAGGLPWQQALAVRDHQSPYISNSMEREADEFAQEILFQGNRFTDMAAKYPIDIRNPFRWAGDWQTTLRDTVGRYVTTNRAPIAFFAAEDTLNNWSEQSLTWRRSGESDSFARLVGPVRNWLPNPLRFGYDSNSRDDNRWIQHVASLGQDRIDQRRGFEYTEGYFELSKSCPGQRFAYQAGWCPTSSGGRIFVLVEMA
jgi:hypothetical protein